MNEIFNFRSIRFNYKDNTEVLGISGYKYNLDETLIGNASNFEDNSCYNPYPDTSFYLPNGSEIKRFLYLSHFSKT